MINSLYNYSNIFRATQVSFAAQSKNNDVSTTTVPMVQRVRPISCPVCRGEKCAHMEGIKKGQYPRYDVVDEKCLAPVPEYLIDSKNPHADKDIKLKPEVLEAFIRMHNAALKDKKFNKKGTQILLDAGFRDKPKQAAVAKNAPTRAAPVGHTEHHTGCAIDVSFRGLGKNSDVYKWLKEHAEEFNFEFSYPENNDLGVRPECWHLRYNADLEKKNQKH